MELRWGIVVAVVLTVLAGCVENQPNLPTLSLPTPDPVSLLPESRPLVATSMIHETVDESAVGGEDIEGATAWEPRDVPLSYHGVQEVYDEWGRAVLSHVFQYFPMELVIDSVEFAGNEVEISGHYEETQVEYAFDAADGRFLGPRYVEDEFRFFADPLYRDSLVWGWEAPLFLFMMAHAQGERIGERVPIGPDLNASLQSYDGWRPFEGDCDAFQLVVEHSSPRSAPSEDDGEVTLVCTQPSTPIALWAWTGSQADGGVGYQRLDAGFALPELAGEPLAAAPHTALPFEPGPVVQDLKPVYTPVSDGGQDWADNLAQRLVGLYTDPDYMVYIADKDELYLEHAAVGWPPSLPGPLLVLMVPDPLFDDAAWLMTTPGEGFYWSFIKSRWGNVEQPDVHVMERQGADFGFSGWPYPPLSEVRSVPIGSVVGGLTEIAPAIAQGLQFYVAPRFTDDFPLIVDWIGYGSCFTADAKPSQVAAINGLDGALWAAGLGRSNEHGCDSMMGGMSTYLSGDNPTLRPMRDGARHGVLHHTTDGPSFVVWADARVNVLG